jgi:hypothetical protein
MAFLPVIQLLGTPYGTGPYGWGAYGGAVIPELPDICVEIDRTNDPTNPTRVWTDVTPQLRQLTSTRSGRNDELQRTETGTLNALFDNRSDAMTSLGIRKRQWIRYRAQWSGVTYARWQGLIEGAPRQWPSAGRDAIVQLRAAGPFKVFRLYDLEGRTFPSQRGDQRFSSLATLVGLTTSSVDTDTDTLDAVSTPISQGTDALSTLLEIEASENGLALEGADGTVSFQGRHWRMLHSATSKGTFGESAGQIPYRDTVELEDDDQWIANNITVTPNGGLPVNVADATSQAKYFTTRLNRTLLTSSSSVALDAANYLLNRYKDPTPRLPTLDVHLAAVAKQDPTLVATLLAAVNSDRFTWTRAATTPISEDVYVEQISETVAPQIGWTMRFQCSPAADESGWVLGDAVNGVLGTTTKLVY